MKIHWNRMLPLLLSLLLMLSCLPVNVIAGENQDLLVEEEITWIPDVRDLPDNDTLLAGYFDRELFGTGISFFGEAARERLEGNVALAYDALVPLLRGIAGGERESSKITIGHAFTNYPVDVDVALNGTSFSSEELSILLDALLADLPYDLYWYDKTTSTSVSIAKTTTKMQLTFKFPVSGNYAPEGATGGYTADLSLTGAASEAAATAKTIAAEQVQGFSDYEKLVYFKNYICDAVSYDYDASSEGSFSENNDPWQTIHVFDGDPDTKVVCEGYSKAFQYLCDLAEFQDDSVACYSVTGMTSGPHMWNIVSIGDENYMVDLTNTDPSEKEGSYTFGQDGSLFLAGGEGSIAEGYSFTNSYGNTLTYQYSYTSSNGKVVRDSLDLWGEGEDSILNLASEDYKNSEQPQPESDPCYLDAIEVSLEGEIVLRMKTILPEKFLADENARAILWSDGAEKIYTVPQLLASDADADGRYVLEYPLASAEMTKEVSLRFLNGEGEAVPVTDYADGTTAEQVTRSVLDYAALVLEKGSDEQKHLITALLTYGGYAQQYFGIDAENPAYDLLTQYGVEIPSLEAITAETIDQQQEKGGPEMGVRQTARRAFLNSATSLRVYFELDNPDMVDSFGFTLTYPENGEEKNKNFVPVYEAEKNRYYVEIASVPAAYLDNLYTITVTNEESGETYSVTTSVLSYLRSVLETSSDDQERNLAKAMYLYNQAANDFFGR